MYNSERNCGPASAANRCSPANAASQIRLLSTRYPLRGGAPCPSSALSSRSDFQGKPAHKTKRKKLTSVKQNEKFRAVRPGVAPFKCRNTKNKRMSNKTEDAQPGPRAAASRRCPTSARRRRRRCCPCCCPCCWPCRYSPASQKPTKSQKENRIFAERKVASQKTAKIIKQR